MRSVGRSQSGHGRGKHAVHQQFAAVCIRGDNGHQALFVELGRQLVAQLDLFDAVDNEFAALV